jgi:DNA-3-methyladenine glycosylase
MQKGKVFGAKFFKRSAVDVAHDLLGKYLVRKVGKEIVYHKITETEAYEGPEDLASHASKGKTARTEVMFGEAGRIYIYLVYGMHYMLNVVTGDIDHPAAVLIRSTATISGPGRVTKQLSITRELNALPAIPKSGLWFEDSEEAIYPQKITKTTRIGVNYAGPIWSQKEYRFILK